jgi:hypothetical protein
MEPLCLLVNNKDTANKCLYGCVHGLWMLLVDWKDDCCMVPHFRICGSWTHPFCHQYVYCSSWYHAWSSHQHGVVAVTDRSGAATLT